MLEQIKEALKKATPGPWNKEGCELWHRGESYSGNSPHAYIGDLKMMQDRNAHLIANTPTYIRYLLDELEKAQKELEFQSDDEHEKFNLLHSVLLEVEELRSEHTAMKEALERISGTTMSMFLSLEEMIRYIKEISTSTLSQPKTDEE